MFVQAGGIIGSNIYRAGKFPPYFQKSGYESELLKWRLILNTQNIRRQSAVHTWQQAMSVRLLREYCPLPSHQNILCVA